MSCVGQVHPYARQYMEAIRTDFGVCIATELVHVAGITYGDLQSMLNCSGTELLIVDAEEKVVEEIAVGGTVDVVLVVVAVVVVVVVVVVIVVVVVVVLSTH